MVVRYCRSCDTEFQPQVVRCSDCGGELEDAWPDEEESSALAAPLDEAAPGVKYVAVARDLSSRLATRAGRKLKEAGIPFRLEAPTHHGFQLGVPTDKAGEAIAILEKARAIPPQPSADAPPVGEAGGPCPACGAVVAPGSAECPDCGLCIGPVDEFRTCPSCGCELASPGDPCRACSS